MFYETAERADAPLDGAIAIGVDPLMLLASPAIAPIDFGELTIAGALQRIRVPREESVDIAEAIGPVPGSSWRKAISD
jgi:2,5-furandicarboxylate decarboxylase 1